jgi:hypothetical protein
MAVLLPLAVAVSRPNPEVQSSVVTGFLGYFAEVHSEAAVILKMGG